MSTITLSKTVFLFLSPLGESPRRGIEVGEGRGRGRISRKIKQDIILFRLLSIFYSIIYQNIPHTICITFRKKHWILITNYYSFRL